MLKLRTFGNSSPTSTVTLTQEYDEIQAANIFPSVQEDQSVASVRSGAMDQSIRSRGSKDSNPNASAEVELLKIQVESLRQQLAERDSIVNDLHQQIQEDKRAHDKLKERYDLFLGVSGTTGGNAGTSTRRLNSTLTCDDGSTMTTAEMLRLHKYMDQLEAEKEASFQKTLSLSVALAESKAKCSTLESQLEEYQSIIKLQNNSMGFNLFNMNNAPAVSAAPVTPPKRATPARNPSVNSTSTSRSLHGFKRSGTTESLRRRANTSDGFLPISDIALAEESQFEINLDSDNEDDHNLEGKVVGGFPDDDTESLGWSGRPLSYFSERSAGSNKASMARRRGSASGISSSSTTSSLNASAHQKQNRNNLLKGFRDMISNRTNNSIDVVDENDDKNPDDENQHSISCIL